jgi:hypothetical protein
LQDQLLPKARAGEAVHVVGRYGPLTPEYLDSEVQLGWPAPCRVQYGFCRPATAGSLDPGDTERREGPMPTRPSPGVRPPLIRSPSAVQHRPGLPPL